MNTTILEAAYEAIQVKSQDSLMVCSVCYDSSSLFLWPPGDYLRTYLESIGFTGDIMLCDQCMRDMNDWPQAWGEP